MNPRITVMNIGSLKAKMSDFYALPSGHPYAKRVEDLPMRCYHIAVPG